jgi:hypothetical protein
LFAPAPLAPTAAGPDSAVPLLHKSTRGAEQLTRSRGVVTLDGIEYWALCPLDGIVVTSTSRPGPAFGAGPAKPLVMEFPQGDLALPAAETHHLAAIALRHLFRLLVAGKARADTATAALPVRSEQV